MQGVPIRIELGPKDMKQKQVVAVRRDTGEKFTLQRDTAVNNILQLLETIHCNMLDKWVCILVPEKQAIFCGQLNNYKLFTV
jgi:prolyl-tRNA synthetase